MKQKQTWIAFLPFLYLVGYVVIGSYFFWSQATQDVTQTENSSGGVSWLQLVMSSVAYLVIGAIGFVFVSVYTLYRLVRERAVFLALQRHWPLLFAILYFFIPNLPGPVDEIVVSTLMGALATYFGLKKGGSNETGENLHRNR